MREKMIERIWKDTQYLRSNNFLDCKWEVLWFYKSSPNGDSVVNGRAEDVWMMEKYILVTGKTPLKKSIWLIWSYFVIEGMVT